MAIYRQIHIDFWQDELVADFTPEDKYFFLYLMTNNKTTQCGVYRINIRIMAFDLGWDQSTVEKMLERFVKYGRIKYNRDESEIFIVNWLKYNSARSPKVAPLIDKQLLDIKTIEFKQDVITLCIQYGYPINTVLQPEPTDNQNQNKNQQKNQQPKIDLVGRFGEVIEQYESHIGQFPSGMAEKVEDALNEFGFDLLVKSFVIAAEKNNRNWRYIEGIHRNWRSKGIKTIERLEQLESDRAKSNVSDDDLVNF